MERSLNARAVVFDIGGVLSAPEGAVPQVSVALGLPVDTVSPAYWAPRERYDRGGMREEYWAAVGSALGMDLTPRAVELDDLDARRWGALTPAAAALIDEVVLAARAREVRLAVLSNAPLSLAEVVRASSWSDPFDALVFSCDLRAAKPEQQAYSAVEAALDLPGETLVFFDDRPVNVAAARDRGWRAHLWNGAPDARRRLVEEGVIDG